MVYIDRNGCVLEKQPWDFNRFIQIIISFWFIVVHFLKTLCAPFRTENRGGNRNNGRSSGGWGSGGGGGGGWGSGGGGGGGNPGLRPNRHIGRITNSMDCNIPGGGCSTCPSS